MNVAVSCPRCGTEFDATGGGAGTFSTVRGEFWRVVAAAQSVRNALTHADAQQLADLLRVLEYARREPDAAQALREELGAFPAFEAWAERNPAYMKLLTGVALPVLLMIVSILAHRADQPSDATDGTPPAVVEQPADEEIERLVREALADRYPTLSFPPAAETTGLDSGTPGNGHSEVGGDTPTLGENSEDTGRKHE